MLDFWWSTITVWNEWFCNSFEYLLHKKVKKNKHKVNNRCSSTTTNFC